MDLDSLHPPSADSEKKILAHILSCLPCWSYLAMRLKPWGQAPASVTPVYLLLLEESGWVTGKSCHLTTHTIPLEFTQETPAWPSEQPASVCVGTGRVTTDCKLLTKQNTFIWSLEPEWKWPVGCIIEQGRD